MAKSPSTRPAAPADAFLAALPEPPRAAPGGRDSSRKKSLYLGPCASQALSAAPNASARLERMARRFEQQIRALVPQSWSMGDWAVVTLALRDWDGVTDTEVWRNVMGWGHIYHSQVQAIYELDPVEIAERLAAAGPAANAAVMEIADRYWEMPEALTHAERMERLGLASRLEIQVWERAQRRRDAAIDQLRHEAESMKRN